MEYEKYLEKNRDAMIASLQKVIRINSEEKDPVTDSDGRIYPFGAGVQEALEATLEIGQASWDLKSGMWTIMADILTFPEKTARSWRS